MAQQAKASGKRVVCSKCGHTLKQHMDDKLKMVPCRHAHTIEGCFFNGEPLTVKCECMHWDVKEVAGATQQEASA